MPCRKTANRSALMYAGLTLLAGLALPASVDAETAATHRQPGDTAACEALQGRTLGPARVTQARMVVSANSVAACEVTAVKADRPGFLMRATLPQHWSGDLVHGGGGGMDGTLPSQIWAAVQPNQRDMVYLVSNGGHVGSSGADASNFAQDPEGRLDYAYRAIGYTDDFGDALTASYYGQKPGHRYFVGCSKGGFDALQAARFYPQRYDGIVAQAPAPHIDAWVAWVGYYGTLTPLPDAKWSMLYQAYLNTCDSLDGLSDGVVSNIGACRFDPASVPGLTPQERRTVNAIASDLKLKDGTVVYPGYWWGPQFKAFDAMGSLGQEWMRRMIFKDPAYDPASFDLETAWPRIQAVNAPFKDNIPSDAIADYLKSGRKLIMITGGDDPTESLIDILRYRKQIAKQAGASAANMKMYLLPGVTHCGGLPLSPQVQGASSVDMIGMIQQWVSSGKPQQRPISVRVDDAGKPQRSRPLCEVGSYPRYTGEGDPNDQSSFTCAPEADIS